MSRNKCAFAIQSDLDFSKKILVLILLVIK